MSPQSFTNLSSHGGNSRLSSNFFLEQVSELISRIDKHDIESLGRQIQRTGEVSGKIFLAGNGGSAATAQHFASDLMGAGLQQDRNKPDVICLSANISVFSAFSNDYGYDNVFVKQISGRIQPTDLLILFSVSGNSRNCIEAARYANAMDAPVVSLLGFDGGELGTISNKKIIIDCNNFYAVESCHLVIVHAITNWLQQHPIEQPI